MAGAGRVLERVHGADGVGVAAADLMTLDADGDGGELGLYVRLYYPTEPFAADAQSDATSLPTFGEHADECIAGFASIFGAVPLVGGLLGRLAAAHVRKYEARARWPVKWHGALQRAAGDARLPVVVVSPGFGGTRCGYHGYACSLVAHGCIAVVVESGYGTSAWTRRSAHPSIELAYSIPMRHSTRLSAAFRQRWFHMVADRSKELLRVLDLVGAINEGGVDKERLFVGADFDWGQLRGALDTGRLVAAGHSLGGPTVLRAAADDGRRRICACVLLDAPLCDYTKALAAPVLDLDMPIFHVQADKVIVPLELERHELVVENRPRSNQMAVIKGTTHFTFGDSRFMGRWFGGTAMDIVLAESLVGRITKELAMWPADGDMQRFPSEETRGQFAGHLAVRVTDAHRRRMKLGVEFAD